MIPNKLYFRIGEVADILSVKPYVLRYWETEFPDIRPSKSKSGQRLYKRRDVETLLQIKTLLYQERFTIDGARKRLREQWREARDHQNGNGHSEAAPQVSSSPLSPPPQPQTSPVQQSALNLPETKKRVAAPAVAPAENHKLLLKLRKDLETVLEALHT